MVASKVQKASGPVQDIIELVSSLSPYEMIEDLHRKRRGSKRFPLNQTLLLGDFSENRRFRATLRAYGRDISYMGIGLLTEKPMPVGSTIQLSLEPLGRTGKFLTLKIVNCAQLLPNTYRVGAQFVFERNSQAVE